MWWVEQWPSPDHFTFHRVLAGPWVDTLILVDRTSVVAERLYENYTAKNANMFDMKAVRGPSQAYLKDKYPNFEVGLKCIIMVF